MFVWRIPSTAEPFLTNFSMMMHHHVPGYHSRKLVCYLQCQSDSEDSLKVTVSTISTELLIFLHPKGGHGIVAVCGSLSVCFCTQKVDMGFSVCVAVLVCAVGTKAKQVVMTLHRG